jgi:hypothetical protein
VVVEGRGVTGITVEERLGRVEGVAVSGSVVAAADWGGQTGPSQLRRRESGRRVTRISALVRCDREEDAVPALPLPPEQCKPKHAELVLMSRCLVHCLVPRGVCLQPQAQPLRGFDLGPGSGFDNHTPPAWLGMPWAAWASSSMTGAVKCWVIIRAWMLGSLPVFPQRIVQDSQGTRCVHSCAVLNCFASNAFASRPRQNMP